jgi:hypothetical protein
VALVLQGAIPSKKRLADVHRCKCIAIVGAAAAAAAAVTAVTAAPASAAHIHTYACGVT